MHFCSKHSKQFSTALKRTSLLTLMLSHAWLAQAADFNIPAQPLDKALNSLAKQSGERILFSTDLTEKITAPAVKGNLTTREALNALLKNSSLVWQGNATQGYTVVKKPPQSPEREETLPEVAVKAEAEQETATSHVSGYVAKRASTATKTDASILETPQSISVITRDELDMRNAQRDGDALRYTSGVFTETYGNDIRPGYDVGIIRGFDPITSGMYRDGLKETNGFWSRISTDLSTVERIEVLKGPASVLYGQGDPAGVINKVTKKPTDKPFRQIELQAGNFDRYQGSFDFSGPVDDEGKVLFRVIGLARDSDTQYKYNNSHSGKDDREVFAPSITFKPSDKTTLTLQADYLNARTGVPFTVGTATTATDTMLGDYTYDGNQRKQINYGYLFEHVFNDNLTFRQNLRISDIDFRYKRMAEQTRLGNLIARRRSINDEQLNGVAIDNHMQVKFETGDIKHTALVGFDFQRSTFTNKQGTANAATADDLLDPANPVYGRNFSTPDYTSEIEQSIKQLGLYAQDQIKFDEHWVLTLSGRKDWSKTDSDDKVNDTSYKQDNDKFTYRSGLAYVFDSGFAPYISHTTSFNPNLVADINNVPHKPTTGKQDEIGFRYIPPGSRSSLTFSIFELTQQNIAAFQFVPDFKVISVGEIRSRGAELEIKTELLDNLNLISALTYNDVEITKPGPNSIGEKGDRPIYVPRKGASLWLDYKVQTGLLAGLGIGGGVRYVGNSNGGNPEDPTLKYENKPFTLFDAALNYRLNKHWNLAVNANNLFDKNYKVCGFSACQLGYERTVIGTLRYNF